MVVCVSNIIWSEGDTAEDGSPILPHPELEVTDGWYKLRAEIDSPLARAVHKGFIRVGRKLAVTGAKVSVLGSAAGRILLSECVVLWRKI